MLVGNFPNVFPHIPFSVFALMFDALHGIPSESTENSLVLITQKLDLFGQCLFLFCRLSMRHERDYGSKTPSNLTLGWEHGEYCPFSQDLSQDLNTEWHFRQRKRIADLQL
jgi:hypothetical protein